MSVWLKPGEQAAPHKVQGEQLVVKSVRDDGTLLLTGPASPSGSWVRPNKVQRFSPGTAAQQKALKEREKMAEEAAAGLGGEAMEMLRLMLHKSQSVIKHHLTSSVFPTLMHFQVQKISASGGDLGGNILFERRLGFTGTPSDLLPLSMGKCGFKAGIA